MPNVPCVSSTQAQKEAAIRSGNFLDLTAEGPVSDEALEAARAEVEAGAEDAAAQRRRAKRAEATAQVAAQLVRDSAYANLNVTAWS